MRHITDGELHTYLDGALDILPEDRGDDVREHLSSCPVCRERLQDEEAIRASAQDLMGAPDLEGLALPSFEELRERAEAGGAETVVPVQEAESHPRYRGPLKGLPLAWAATVVLALGVGWMGGEVWRALPQGGPGVDFATVDQMEALEANRLEAEALDVIPVVEPPPPQAQLADFETERSRVATPLQATVGEPEEESREDFMGEALGDPRSAMEAADLAVPGLKVLSVEWEEWVPGERALRIRQLLSMGDTLELRYLGMLIGTDPEPSISSNTGNERAEGWPALPLSPIGLAASLPPGWNQVEVRWGRGWLVARARLPEATLRSLLRSLR